MRGRENQAEPWELMRRGVPRGRAQILASILGLNVSSVQRWLREPLSDENPTGTGAPNPIERMDRTMEFFAIHAPAVAQECVDRWIAFLDELHRSDARQPLSAREQRTHIADVLRESAEAIGALIEEAPPAVLRKEFEEFKLKMERLIRRAEAGEWSGSPSVSAGSSE